MSNYFFRPVLRDLTKGARLEFIREFRYLDEKNVAEELGLGGKDLARTVRDYERNATKPLPGRLEELTKILMEGVKIEDNEEKIINNEIKKYKNLINEENGNLILR